MVVVAKSSTFQCRKGSNLEKFLHTKKMLGAQILIGFILLMVVTSGSSSALLKDEGQETVTPADPITTPEDDNYSYYSSEDYQEGECDANHFYHIRGHACVPYRCPRGNSQRNFDTGECLYTSELIENINVARDQDDVLIADQLLLRAPPDLPHRWWYDQPKGLAKMMGADIGRKRGRSKALSFVRNNKVVAVSVDAYSKSDDDHKQRQHMSKSTPSNI